MEGDYQAEGTVWPPPRALVGGFSDGLAAEERANARVADIELLAHLFASANIGGARKQAEVLVAYFSSLASIIQADCWSLRAVAELQSDVIKFIESLRRFDEARFSEALKPKKAITVPEALVEYAVRLMSGKETEELRVVFLNRRCEPIEQGLQYIGQRDSVKFPHDQVLRSAVHLNASFVAVMHNHPSGDPYPSPSDVDETNQLRKKLHVIDVVLLDHIIVGMNSHTSMHEMGIL